MSKFLKHLGLVLRHKAKVFKLCCKCGMPWRGLVHDLSKFSITEFGESVKYFTGKRSPISVCREQNGYSKAWIHHKNRNKHHLEYWFDIENKEQINMPFKYAVECVCDKIAATKCYKGKDYKPEYVLEHWQNKGSKVPTNERMREFFTTVFTDLIEKGEKAIVNRKYLKNKYKTIVLNKEKDL